MQLFFVVAGDIQVQEFGYIDVWLLGLLPAGVLYVPHAQDVMVGYQPFQYTGKTFCIQRWYPNQEALVAMMWMGYGPILHLVHEPLLDR